MSLCHKDMDIQSLLAQKAAKVKDNWSIFVNFNDSLSAECNRGQPISVLDAKVAY